MKFLLIPLLLVGSLVHAAGTVNINDFSGFNENQRLMKVITASFTGDATDGTLPTKSVFMCGTLARVFTDPGSTAPSSNWDVFLYESDGATDLLNAECDNRHASNSETCTRVVFNAAASAYVPLALCGEYTLEISGNSNASATGSVKFLLWQ